VNITAVDTLIAETANMERAVEFYRDVLELPPMAITPQWSAFLLGAVRLALHPPMGEDFPGPGSWVVGLNVRDLDALRQRLAQHGTGSSEPHEIPGGRVSEFRDPDGNRIQAVERHA